MVKNSFANSIICFSLPIPTETIESYEFLKRRSNSNARVMRGGRNYVDDHEHFTYMFPKHIPDVRNTVEDEDTSHDKRSGRVKRFSGHSNRWRRTQRVSFLAGVRIMDPKRSSTKYSGYQVMRLATELIPAYSAILGKLS